MAGLISRAVRRVKSLFFPVRTTTAATADQRGPYGLPLPARRHQVITEDELAHRRLVVIGDVHGCYDELVELLDKCQARDGNSCLTVFVGDLVNKGPKSADVVKLVRSISAYCVRGNHDEVALREWQLHRDEGLQLQTQFEWLAELSKDDLDWMFALPYTITIPSLQTIIVHAGLVPGVPVEEQDLGYIIHARDLKLDPSSSKWVGSRKASPGTKPWASVWAGPQHVYFGHDAARLFQDYDYATGLDTGCVYGGSLTAVFPEDNRKIIQVKSHAVYRKVA